MERRHEPHVLLLPYPSQGHINPMLQFAKRLAFHGIRTTLATTRFILGSTRPQPGPVSVEAISDGFDRGGFPAAAGVEDYLARLESVGSETLADLLERLRSKGHPVHVLVYDAFLPWARAVADRFGLRTAGFFTQACVVDAILWQVWEGRLKYPVTEPVELVPGLPRFEPRDLPSFLSDPGPGQYPAYLELVLNQFKELDKADAVLINSFYELEAEEFSWMKTWWRVKSIGPTLPSTYVDRRVPWDSHYGFDLHAPDSQPYLAWLGSKPSASVIYVSFGSMASLSPDQTAELASALANTKYGFLWVVRASELATLPGDFVEGTAGKGLVVTWCNQLEVLASDAVGCFVTHCGWNSTTEGIALGVPMVGFPQWTDQPTDAKYVEQVWGVGVRVRAEDGGGIVRGAEFARCIGEVMEGERSVEIRKNSAKWRSLAMAAVGEGGSSDKSIVEFIDEVCM